MVKRKYYPVDKQKIAEAIAAYKEWHSYITDYTIVHDNEKDASLWDKFTECWGQVCPNSNVWAANIMQPMLWSNTLTVERVYHAILAMGINTREVEYED